MVRLSKGSLYGTQKSYIVAQATPKVVDLSTDYCQPPLMCLSHQKIKQKIKHKMEQIERIPN